MCGTTKGEALTSESSESRSRRPPPLIPGQSRGLNEKALEAAYRAAAREPDNIWIGAFTAYFASLTEQGIVLADVREITNALLSSPLSPVNTATAIDFIEARFGGNP